MPPSQQRATATAQPTSAQPTSAQQQSPRTGQREPPQLLDARHPKERAGRPPSPGECLPPQAQTAPADPPSPLCPSTAACPGPSEVSAQPVGGDMCGGGARTPDPSRQPLCARQRTASGCERNAHPSDSPTPPATSAAVGAAAAAPSAAAATAAAAAPIWDPEQQLMLATAPNSTLTSAEATAGRQPAMRSQPPSPPLLRRTARPPGPAPASPELSWTNHTPEIPIPAAAASAAALCRLTSHPAAPSSQHTSAASHSTPRAWGAPRLAYLPHSSLLP
ncbi:MAG: hypothetical protein WDW36_004625 [Sanguina aurantia]